MKNKNKHWILSNLITIKGIDKEISFSAVIIVFINSYMLIIRYLRPH
jgi:hypothetical protein